MGVFTYKGLDRQQLPVQGTISADTPRQARDLLRGRGLIVRELHHEASRRAALWPWSWKRRHTSKLATAVRELATLLSVGIPLTESLDTLCQQHRGSFRKALLLLHERVCAGVSLAEAMAEQPLVFDSLCVHMVEVGENSGNLEDVLDQLADFKERSLEFKDRVLTAILYPSIVLGAAVVVSLFLMTIVVPTLLSSLLEAGRPLPWPTRILKGASDLLVQHGFFLALGVGMLILIAALGLRTDAGQRLWQRLLLRIPLIGPMAQKQAISRIALVMATLIKSGIVYLKAVEIAARL